MPPDNWLVLRNLLSESSRSFLSANPEWAWILGHLMFGAVLGLLFVLRTAPLRTASPAGDPLGGPVGMPTAVWNGVVIAASDHTIKLEGNRYFPPDSIRREYLAESGTHTRCPWKGLASYCDIVVDGKTNRDGAWTYPEPSEAAKQIKDYVAFWHGVRVTR